MPDEPSRKEDDPSKPPRTGGRAAGYSSVAMPPDVIRESIGHVLDALTLIRNVLARHGVHEAYVDGITLFALEAVCSIVRRRGRDFGVTRDEMRSALADASAYGGKLYEETGEGDRNRKRAALLNNVDKSPLTPESESIAVNLIRNALDKKEPS